MKKYLSILLILTITLGLVACNKQEVNNSSVSETSTIATSNSNNTEVIEASSVTLVNKDLLLSTGLNEDMADAIMTEVRKFTDKDIINANMFEQGFVCGDTDGNNIYLSFADGEILSVAFNDEFTIFIKDTCRCDFHDYLVAVTDEQGNLCYDTNGDKLKFSRLKYLTDNLNFEKYENGCAYFSNSDKSYNVDIKLCGFLGKDVENYDEKIRELYESDKEKYPNYSYSELDIIYGLTDKNTTQYKYAFVNEDGCHFFWIESQTNVQAFIYHIYTTEFNTSDVDIENIDIHELNYLLYHKYFSF